MPRPSLTRLIIPMLLLVAAAVAAGQSDEWLERAFIMTITGLVALFIGTDPGLRAARPRRRDSGTPGRITHHPDFQAFIDVSSDPGLIVEDGRVTRANRAALNLFGSHVVGADVRTAIRHAGAIERLLEPNADHAGQPIRLTGIGQRDQQWDMRIRALSGGQKVVALADRTESQAAERMRVDFVANASHELLTPLGSVKGFIETLRETDAAADPETREKFLSIMAEEANRMQELIRDLMSLSRIEAEKYQPVEEEIDLADLLTEVVANLASGSNRRGADIVLDVARDLPKVAGDKRQLIQLATNLLANSMKYGRPDTPIRASLFPTRSGSMVSMLIEDEGEGIAPEHIPRLTERFYRVDPGRSRAVGGTGLGLSLVKHIVDRHRGHLGIASEPGRGTRVSILLPVVTS